MPKPTDPRTLQTKALIRKTLLELLQKAPFSKLTVKELCARAGINRGTFYLHYRDLLAVVEELVELVITENTGAQPYVCA